MNNSDNFKLFRYLHRRGNFVKKIHLQVDLYSSRSLTSICSNEFPDFLIPLIYIHSSNDTFDEWIIPIPPMFLSPEINFIRKNEKFTRSLIRILHAV